MSPRSTPHPERKSRKPVRSGPKTAARKTAGSDFRMLWMRNARDYYSPYAYRN